MSGVITATAVIMRLSYWGSGIWAPGSAGMAAERAVSSGRMKAMKHFMNGVSFYLLRMPVLCPGLTKLQLPLSDSRHVPSLTPLIGPHCAAQFTSNHPVQLFFIIRHFSSYRTRTSVQPRAPSGVGIGEEIMTVNYLAA